MGDLLNSAPRSVLCRWQAMLAQCAGVVDAACCCGSGMARPLLLLELCKGYDLDDPKVIDSLICGLKAANATQPGYSRVLKHHVLFAEQVRGGLE